MKFLRKICILVLLVAGFIFIQEKTSAQTNSCALCQQQCLQEENNCQNNATNALQSCMNDVDADYNSCMSYAETNRQICDANADMDLVNKYFDCYDWYGAYGDWWGYGDCSRDAEAQAQTDHYMCLQQYNSETSSCSRSYYTCNIIWNQSSNDCISTGSQCQNNCCP